MGTLLLGGISVLAIAIWLRFCARFQRSGRRGIPPGTAIGAWVLYLLYSFLVTYAAWYAYGSLPLSFGVAVLAGAALIAAGASLYGAGLRALGSWERTSGLTVDRLVTDGIYRWSRNPQMLGWTLVLSGVALLGRSGLALLLALGSLAISVAAIRGEERTLEEAFGDVYRRYRARTPRFLGLPRGRSTPPEH